MAAPKQEFRFCTASVVTESHLRCKSLHNSSESHLRCKSLHNSSIIPTKVAQKRGNLLESLIDLPWFLKILLNLSVIPESNLWEKPYKNRRKITFGLCPDFYQSFSTKMIIWVLTKLLHLVYHKDFRSLGLRYWFTFSKILLSACHHCQNLPIKMIIHH